MSIKISRKGNRIRFTGQSANIWMAHAMVDSDGANALKGVAECGPLRDAVLEVMRERGITPNPDENKRDTEHPASPAG